ncbi:MAG: ferredoxin [Microthrixaceae bacterium]|nr:ferredoxin [Microthrixaceae bacterium]
MTLRIEIDRDLCQGHGVCEGEAPEVFELSKKGELTVLRPEPDESLRPQVEAAAKYCPTRAIKLLSD